MVSQKTAHFDQIWARKNAPVRFLNPVQLSQVALGLSIPAKNRDVIRREGVGSFEIQGAPFAEIELGCLPPVFEIAYR